MMPVESYWEEITWDVDPSWFQMLHDYYRDTEIIWSCCTPAAFRPTLSSCVSLKYRCCCFLIACWCWLCCIPTVLLSYWVTFVTSRHRTAMSRGECCASCGHCWLVKGETCSNLMRRSVRNSILQPCYSHSCWRCISRLLPFSETAVRTARRWGEGRPWDMLLKTAVELSHTATRYSHGKAFLERDRFLNNRTTLPRCSVGSRVPAAPAERGILSSSGGPHPDRCGLQDGSSMEALKYHLPEISNSTQGAGWLACLT